MKFKLQLAITLTLISVATFAQKKLPIIKATSKKVDIRIGKTFSKGIWTISPQIKPDRLPIECGKETQYVSFITDIDSVKFPVNLGETYSFIILLNNKDSAFTEIIGIPKNVNFTDEYIQKHKGKLEVEIPEVHELANILVAISNVGQLDSNMIDMTTTYHKEVLKHFLPFKNHKIMDTINHYITRVRDENSYWYYYALKMNACAYVFDKNGSINNTGIIRKMGFNNPEDPLINNKKNIEDFAIKSNFRAFYKSHQTYYNSLIVTYKQLNPIDKMQTWLEKKYGFSYGNYSVLFSPLVGGAHATQAYEDNGFEQTFMFVCRAEHSSKYNRNVNEMLESRVVFTEIDHNFVNPLSNKKTDIIDSAFSDRKKWTKEDNLTNAYESAYKVFNEYMTWSIFSLYCYDNFPKEDVELFIQRMENQMENKRGFIKFRIFNQQLIKIYKNNPNISMSELCDTILKWSSNQ